MRPDLLLAGVAILVATSSAAYVISDRRKPFPLLTKMDEITRQLLQLTSNMAELDAELTAVLNPNHRLKKRSTTEDRDRMLCRFGPLDDICRVWEMLQQKQHGEPGDYLKTATSPGKRSGPNDLQQAVDELNQRRNMVQALHKVFDNAGHIMEREKKWFTCKLNLGYTCQTEQYNAMADTWDFLNSAGSPGKRKRSSPEAPLAQPQQS